MDDGGCVQRALLRRARIDGRQAAAGGKPQPPVAGSFAAAAGGKGGGKPHMAQAGIPDAGLMASVVAGAAETIRKHIAAAA